MKKLQCNGKVAIVESANVRACATMSTIVLMKEGCGALLQYPSQLEIRLVEEPYGPPKVSTSPKVNLLFGACAVLVHVLCAR